MYRISDTRICRNSAQQGRDYCWQHPGAPRGGTAGEAGRTGGRPAAAPLPLDVGARRGSSRLQRPARYGHQGSISGDEDALRWLAERVRVHTSGTSGGITAEQTMQNYHGIAAVRRMAQPGALPYGAKTVFAGGTCLALGHRLVERYSEDIDMVIVGCADLGADQRDEVLESLADLVSDRGRFPAARAARSK